MMNTSILMSNNDIPFIEAQIAIHNPTISEIFLIGENVFHPGCQFLNFSIEQFVDMGKTDLGEYSDFDIFMSIICNKEGITYKNYTFQILTILFPGYEITFNIAEGIKLTKGEFATFINKENFAAFKDIIVSMFCLESSGGVDSKYNPADEAARRIAEKLAKRKKSKEEGSAKNLNIFCRLISILSVGERKNIQDLLKLNVYQLKDEFKRFQLKQSFDIYLDAKMAGASDLDEVDNWMDDIHP